MDENNMGNNNSIENNNDANGFVMVDNPAPQASQEPQEPQTENQNQNQPVQPEPEQAQQQNTNYEQPVQPMSPCFLSKAASSFASSLYSSGKERSWRAAQLSSICS